MRLGSDLIDFRHHVALPSMAQVTPLEVLDQLLAIGMEDQPPVLPLITQHRVDSVNPHLDRRVLSRYLELSAERIVPQPSAWRTISPPKPCAAARVSR